MADRPAPAEKTHGTRGTLVLLALNVLTLIAAAGALFVAIWLLGDSWHSSPVAAQFTRVGGPTRVETAVYASHFWLTPPPCVVYVRADQQSQKVIFAAARYAMAHDAPL